MRYNTVMENISLNKNRFAKILNEICLVSDFDLLKNKTIFLKSVIADARNDNEKILEINENENGVSLRKDILISELNQILESQTLERAKYYTKRLKNGVEKIKTGKINDINLSRWKEYDNILTDSLWVLTKRDKSGAHIASYWGNFIPQIPHQTIQRYTKRGECVLDTFLGSGTTLIECKKLGRRGIGFELDKNVAKQAEKVVSKEENPYNIKTSVVVGDSQTINISEILKEQGLNKVQMLIMHPPYHDIIQFSKNKQDLSNASSTEEFLKMFGEVVNNSTQFLEKGRYLVLVIGDKYSKGEWIPLGFHCMNEVIKNGYTLKSIVVKNFEDTKGKRSQKELWRYRALVGGFYVFKHEYVMIFKK